MEKSKKDENSLLVAKFLRKCKKEKLMEILYKKSAFSRVYEKPSVKKRRKRSASRFRQNKLAEKEKSVHS
jgi:hypothetical protein